MYLLIKVHTVCIKLHITEAVQSLLCNTLGCYICIFSYPSMYVFSPHRAGLLRKHNSPDCFNVLYRDTFVSRVFVLYVKLRRCLPTLNILIKLWQEKNDTRSKKRTCTCICITNEHFVNSISQRVFVLSNPHV